MTTKTVAATERHYLKYRRMAQQFCVDFARDPKMLGRTREEMVALIGQDHHMNNVPRAEWDRLAARFIGMKHDLNVDGEHDGVQRATALHEAVCLVKWAARYQFCGLTPRLVESVS